MNSSFIKFGRILFYCGLGWSIGNLIGTISYGDNILENFSIELLLAVITAIAGYTIMYIFRNKEKLQNLQSQDKKLFSQVCPNCGLALAKECKCCPKCNTNLTDLTI